MNEAIEFKPWQKTPRLFRDMVVTEKIDGTNAAIGIRPVEGSEHPVIYAQSRNRIITPDDDNYGFAKWVYDNYETLVVDLGNGLHFGEWWGRGIQRGYGLTERRFSLFNVGKWEGADFATPGLCSVPVVKRFTFSTLAVIGTLEDLKANGSYAAPGFMSPEGVVVYHTAGNVLFKALLENDDIPKGLKAA